MATRKLAGWISTTSYSSFPEEVLRAATRSFQNSLGCVIGGSSHATVQRSINALQGAQSEVCTCLGQSNVRNPVHGGNHEDSDQDVHVLTTGLSEAALFNGIASHVHDCDDTHLSTVIHPAGAIVASLLAYTEHLKFTSQRLVTGKEFITALVVGIETSLRLGNSISPNHYSAGWHITGTVSPLGVAAALSNLVRLDQDTTIAALGIASTQPVGIRVHFGTDTKSFHVGRAAQIGIQAVQLAQGGFTAAIDALEGKRGWVEVLGHGANTLDEQIQQLLDLAEQAKTKTRDNGTRTPWEIEKNTFKPFPCGIVIHPIIDACIQLYKEHDFSNAGNIENVVSVHLKVHPLVLDLTGKKTPKDGLEAKFSVYHGAAIGLLLGSATPAQYEDDVVTDSKVIAVRDKVTAEADESIRSDEAVVTLTLSDGRKIIKHVEHAVGSLEKPMSDTDLKEKFLDQVSPVLGTERAMQVDRLVWNVAGLEDVTDVARAAR